MLENPSHRELLYTVLPMWQKIPILCPESSVCLFNHRGPSAPLAFHNCLLPCRWIKTCVFMVYFMLSLCLELLETELHTEIIRHILLAWPYHDTDNETRHFRTDFKFWVRVKLTKTWWSTIVDTYPFPHTIWGQLFPSAMGVPVINQVVSKLIYLISHFTAPGNVFIKLWAICTFSYDRNISNSFAILIGLFIFFNIGFC